MRAAFEVKEPGRFKTLIEKVIENCPVHAISMTREESKGGDGRG
jgi:hypothetical protein